MNSDETGASPRVMWSSSLQCAWISWTVLNDGALRLDVPDHHCCDMSGAILMAEALCPLVWRVEIYADGKLDMIYVHHGGKWRAINERPDYTHHNERG